MLYSQNDREIVAAELGHRRRLVILPALALLLLAIASYVWFRLHRDEGGWIWTALLTVAAGAYFLFFYEVYLRPVQLYARHVGYMLDGRKRETVGRVKEIRREIMDREGLDCQSFTVNIGEKDDPEDDRLFYVDALKGMPDIQPGARVRVFSNDRAVAGLEILTGEC